MIGNKSFEDLKQINQHGAEYWSARDLQPLLGYSQWRRFEQAIERAVTSCKQSENPAEHHFASAGKPITANHSPLNPTQHHFAGAGKPIAYTART
ncbi:MAG: DNA protein [Gammaproteobacteria bacterium]|nr:DNA protein [Gammaproteobacteria bacterium]